MIVTYSTYNKEKKDFFKKHKNNFKVETSPLNEYNVYYKVYAFSDGATWTERMEHVFREVKVEVMKCSVNVEVELLETEYYDTDNANSRKYYEKW